MRAFRMAVSTQLPKSVRHRDDANLDFILHYLARSKTSAKGGGDPRIQFATPRLRIR